MTTTTNDKAVALSVYLELPDVGEVIDARSTNDYFSLANSDEEYLVLTEEERFDVASDYINESLFTFKAVFLSSYTGLPEVIFEKLSELHEDANEAIRALVETEGDFDEFVQHAVDADGFGEFLSGYDGKEIDLGNGLFAYRIN